MKTIVGLYSVSDWAELFSLCASVKDIEDTQSPHYIESADKVWEWLCEWSKAHDFPQPEETDKWSDTRYVIKEAVMFLEKFAENHHDDFQNRKEAQDEQLRRDEKNGLYPGRWDDSN